MIDHTDVKDVQDVQDVQEITNNFKKNKAKNMDSTSITRISKNVNENKSKYELFYRQYFERVES